MTDDKAFDFLLTALRTRESSTLVIATVATSASLILLGVRPVGIDPTFLVVLGIVSPLLGFFYREITIVTIDQEEFDKIECRMNESEKSAIARSDSVKRYGKVRGLIFRTFLLIAPIAWAFVATENPVPAEFKLAFGGLWIGIAILGAYLANKVEWYIRALHEQRRKAPSPSLPTSPVSPSANWFERHPDFIPLLVGIGAGSMITSLIIFYTLSNEPFLSSIVRIIYFMITIALITGTVVSSLCIKIKRKWALAFFRGIPVGSFITVLIFVGLDLHRLIRFLFGV